jgi:hypothetical protein
MAFHSCLNGDEPYLLRNDSFDLNNLSSYKYAGRIGAHALSWQEQLASCTKLLLLLLQYSLLENAWPPWKPN